MQRNYTIILLYYVLQHTACLIILMIKFIVNKKKSLIRRWLLAINTLTRLPWPNLRVLNCSVVTEKLPWNLAIKSTMSSTEGPKYHKSIMLRKSSQALMTYNLLASTASWDVSLLMLASGLNTARWLRTETFRTHHKNNFIGLKISHGPAATDWLFYSMQHLHISWKSKPLTAVSGATYCKYTQLNLWMLQL